MHFYMFVYSRCTQNAYRLCASKNMLILKRCGVVQLGCDVAELESLLILHYKRMRPAGITVYKSSWLLLETHTKRQATQHDFLPSLLCDGDQRNWNCVGEEKMFYTGPTGAAKPEQKFLVPVCQAELTNQGRAPFICFLWVPTNRSFNGRQGPPLSSLCGYSNPAFLHAWYLPDLSACLAVCLPSSSSAVPSSLCSLCLSEVLLPPVFLFAHPLPAWPYYLSACLNYRAVCTSIFLSEFLPAFLLTFPLTCLLTCLRTKFCLCICWTILFLLCQSTCMSQS
jgi:hypothetical protein